MNRDNSLRRGKKKVLFVQFIRTLFKRIESKNCDEGQRKKERKKTQLAWRVRNLNYLVATIFSMAINEWNVYLTESFYSISSGTSKDLHVTKTKLKCIYLITSSWLHVKDQLKLAHRNDHQGWSRDHNLF